jgi:hypothetical protein
MLKSSCEQSNWQLPSMAQFCSSSLPLVLSFELLHPIIAVKESYLTQAFTLRIPPTLRELMVVTAIEVLPILQNRFLEERHPPGPVI